MSDFFNNNDTSSILEAQYAAQKIAFAPVIFQVAKSMRDLGVLEVLFENDKTGLTISEIAQKTNLSTYGVQTLMETSLSADIVKCNDAKYFITKTGYFLLKDEMTRVNMNYNHYVNYQGLYFLDESIKHGQALGLKTFGNWETIYPALSSLPQEVKTSWFEFDHYYSDSAFSQALTIVLAKEPKNILDIGGNTGKFSIALAKANEDVHVSILDIEEQIVLAKENIQMNGLQNRVSFVAQNILDFSQHIPTGYDLIWMSQFLDCFKSDDIINLLKKVKKSMGRDSYLCIMEPLWDKQRFETSAYCIINTSPYFTALANGVSKMFNSADLVHYIEEAGLEVVEQIDGIGICQSIVICKYVS